MAPSRTQKRSGASTGNQERSRGLPPISDILSSMEADHPPALRSEFRPATHWQVSHNFSFAPNQRSSTDENSGESVWSKATCETPHPSTISKADSTVKTSRARRNNTKTSSTIRSRKCSPSMSDSSPTSSSDHNTPGREIKKEKKKAHADTERQTRKKKNEEIRRAKELVPNIVYPEEPSKTHTKEIASLEILRAHRKYTAALVPYVEELTVLLHEFQLRFAEEKALNQTLVKLLPDVQVTQAKQEMAALSLDAIGSTRTTEGPVSNANYTKYIETLTHRPCGKPPCSYPVSSPSISNSFSWLNHSKPYSSLRDDIVRFLSPKKQEALEQEEPFLIPVLAKVLVKDAQSAWLRLSGSSV